MMAAAQPFLSGAISKTVNMPAEIDRRGHRRRLRWGWKLGLKALAIYRDGSKQSQPLSTKSEGDKAAEKEKEVAARPRRERLPDTRQSLTHKFNVGGHEGYINVGLYPDGRPGELFITMAKEGSTVGGLMDCFGTAISMACNTACRWKCWSTSSRTRGSNRWATRRTRTFASPRAWSTTSSAGSASRSCRVSAKPVSACIRHRPANPNRYELRQQVAVAEPATTANCNATGNGHAADRLRGAERAGVAMKVDPAGGSLSSRSEQFAKFQSDVPSCEVCGSITVRNGNCYLCHNCGNSMGCS